ELRKFLRESICDCGDHQTGVAVADEDDVGQPFVLDQVEDVRDVRVEIDLGIAQVLAFAESRERHRMDFMTVGSQRLPDGMPGPTAEPESRNQYERGHRFLPLEVVRANALRRVRGRSPDAKEWTRGFSRSLASGEMELRLGAPCAHMPGLRPSPERREWVWTPAFAGATSVSLDSGLAGATSVGLGSGLHRSDECGSGSRPAPGRQLISRRDGGV